ncbi:hypothetical protein V8J82_23035 [Gymnodinialimonas sp. 2305UL16-5]|uniref:hypothetical protein n=1 Tax=Gymnodinialimonas mytili TaxID=3126503 RepID=UPI0030A4259B
MSKFIVPLSILLAIPLLVAGLSLDPASVASVEQNSSRHPSDLGEVRQFWPNDGNPIDVVAVAIGPNGDVFAIHRDNRGFSGDGTLIERPVIVRLDPETAEVMAEIGDGIFINPHGLSVGEDGALWVADIGLNSVIRLSQDGTLLGAFGDAYPRWMEPALRLRNVLPRLPVPMSDLTFARPTDVVPLPNGGFAVTDGYRNARLAVFDAEGALNWERNSRGSEVGSFHLLHGLAVDREGRLFVADRRNARIQVFSSDGQVLAHRLGAELGRPFGLDIGDDDCLYVVDGGDRLDTQNLTEEQASRRGLSQTILNDADLEPATRVAMSQRFVLPHDVAVGPDGTVFIADPEAGYLFAVQIEN